MPTLDWIGKSAVIDHHREVPFHLLREHAALSAGDADSGNLLVQGDNLLALKALLPYYAGQVKCIYIDPPYNTGNEGWVYNDNVNSPEIRRWLQQRSLDALRDYFAETRRSGDADAAFYAATRRVFGSGIPYRQVAELPGLPYVCLRIPTGGGKTLVAAHAAGLAARDLVESDRPVVLWLVPSNPIRQQTLTALRDRRHPYRHALEERLGATQVLDLAEALGAPRAHYASGAVVIVATMQAFRVADTEGRKVYEQNGALMDHFTGHAGDVVTDLERTEGGTPVPSLANVLRLYRPIVIVDEAHNARTALAFETLARFRPSCVLEFTATPAREGHASNVLRSVSAAELNAEDMIKLPIRLETRLDWKLLLADAVAQRAALELAAGNERTATGEYVRPVMLIQAEARRGVDPVTVDVVRRTLIDDHRVPEREIAIATGGASDLDGVDVLSPSCAIRFVITVQQLREGWDCPFAYVLCSVGELRASTAVEQLLGRIMRLPHARRKHDTSLNQAYAFAASARFADAALALTDALVQNGFEAQEARDLITAATFSAPNEELPLFAGVPTVVVSAPVAVLPDLATLPSDLAARLTMDPEAGTLTVRGAFSEEDRDALAAAIPGGAGPAIAYEIYERVRQQTQVRDNIRREYAARTFDVPLLAIRQGDLWEPFEQSHFMEAEWDLAQCDPGLTSAEWSPGVSDARVGQVTITDRGRAEYFILEMREQLSMMVDDGHWSVGSLAAWLDRAIPHPDVHPDAAAVFLAGALRYLTEERAIPLGTLVHDKYRIKDVLATKIEQHRRAAYGRQYQAALFDNPDVIVTPEVCFTYEPDRYAYRTADCGRR